MASDWKEHWERRGYDMTVTRDHVLAMWIERWAEPRALRTNILRALDAANAPLTFPELCECVAYNPVHIARELGGLVRRGTVEKEIKRYHREEPSGVEWTERIATYSSKVIH